jgi:putative DNA methylase
MVWDFAEANAFSGAAGDFEVTLKSIGRVVDALPTTGGAVVQQADATAATTGLVGSLVSTDPPYYDNIGYADLSDFFYVWLRRTLADVYPELFATVLTPKAAELVAAAYRFDGNKDAAEKHFETGLGAAFSRMREVTARSVPVTVYYAFKQSESDDGENGEAAVASTGWETMLEGLLHAGFSIDGTWPMRTERTARSISIGSNALASSIVLVCRHRADDASITTRKDFIASLKREMPEALRTLQHGNIAPVDLAQASIGPGMAVFSRYAKVLEPDGSAMRVRTALALINQVLDEILAEQEGEFDPDTRWAIAWYEQFGLNEADSGRAILLTQAKNTSLDGLTAAGIIDAHRGKTRLLNPGEYKSNWDPAKDARVPVWEATHRLVHALLTQNEAAAGTLLARLDRKSVV